MYRGRLVIFTSEIPILTGQSLRSAERLVRKIRAYYKLPPRSLIKIEQFCEFTGFEKEEVYAVLGK